MLHVHGPPQWKPNISTLDWSMFSYDLSKQKKARNPNKQEKKKRKGNLSFL